MPRSRPVSFSGAYRPTYATPPSGMNAAILKLLSEKPQPIQSVGEGVANQGNRLVSALMARRLMDQDIQERQEREDAFNTSLAEVLAGGSTPRYVNPDTGTPMVSAEQGSPRMVPTPQAGGTQGMISALRNNPNPDVMRALSPALISRLMPEPLGPRDAAFAGMTQEQQARALGGAEPEPKQPQVFDYYDEATGRTRRGYLKGGKIVPVGGAKAADEAKTPRTFEYFDKATGRKRVGYFQNGKIVPVGGVKAADADTGQGTAEIKNYHFAKEVLGMGEQEAAAWARMKQTTPKSEIRADVYKRFITANFGDAEEAAKNTDKAMEFLFGDKPKTAAPETQEADEGWATRLQNLVESLTGKKTAAAGEGTEASPYKPTTQEEFDALPSGAVFINPANGQKMRKK